MKTFRFVAAFMLAGVVFYIIRIGAEIARMLDNRIEMKGK